MYLLGIGAAFIVMLHEIHDECSISWLDNMEQVQQHNHDQRDS
jgi:hypothetical protein